MCTYRVSTNAKLPLTYAQYSTIWRPQFAYSIHAELSTSAPASSAVCILQTIHYRYSNIYSCPLNGVHDLWRKWSSKNIPYLFYLGSCAIIRCGGSIVLHPWARVFVSVLSTQKKYSIPLHYKYTYLSSWSAKWFPANCISVNPNGTRGWSPWTQSHMLATSV